MAKDRESMEVRRNAESTGQTKIKGNTKRRVRRGRISSRPNRVVVASDVVNKSSRTHSHSISVQKIDRCSVVTIWTEDVGLALRRYIELGILFERLGVDSSCRPRRRVGRSPST
jgi:hypothetical protein